VWGSDSNRDDYYADELDANLVSAGSGTIDGGKEMVGVDGTSNAGPTTFNSWRQVSSDRAAIIEVNALTETDGTTDGEVRTDVDESGGTSGDYYILLSRADSNLGDGGNAFNSGTLLLPPGAQYQIDNTTDPNGNNVINEVREWIL